jgi:hypothetical protein
MWRVVKISRIIKDEPRPAQTLEEVLVVVGALLFSVPVPVPVAVAEVVFVLLDETVEGLTPNGSALELTNCKHLKVPLPSSTPLTSAQNPLRCPPTLALSAALFIITVPSSPSW